MNCYGCVVMIWLYNSYDYDSFHWNYRGLIMVMVMLSARYEWRNSKIKRENVYGVEREEKEREVKKSEEEWWKKWRRE